MSQRPQPVTSKFRNYYMNDVYKNYNESSKSSSVGSTSSLTSVLHHDSFNDKSSDSDDWHETEQIDNNNHNKEKFEHATVPGRFCKRIIARQPQYPGERITLTKYDGDVRNTFVPTIVSKRISVPHKNRVNQSVGSKSVTRNTGLTDCSSSHRIRVRKVANKSQSEPGPTQNPTSVHNPKKVSKSEDSYSCNDFSSMSEAIPTIKTPDEKVIDDDCCSSIEGNLSISIDNEAPKSTEAVVKNEKSNKMLTAWEAWYLKKEKQKRKKEEIESLKEKETKGKEDEEKYKRKQTCHEKIQSWLIRKEEMQKKEMEMLRKRKEKENNSKEQKKEELIKKSSEKYVEWKLEKEKKEKELEKQDMELKIKVEADKMIQRAKAANAFQRWFEEHKDHQMPVPYSYGISDGKLKSYYDKTSNPAPSFFNPDPWKPLIDLNN